MDGGVPVSSGPAREPLGRPPNMRILAIETATADCSVAVGLGDEVLQLNAAPGTQKPSEQVPGLVTRVLSESGCSLSSIDAIAFDSGPGAFTGIRIGCALAQGLALGADLPLIGLCSLRVLAMQAPEGHVLAILDARMGEIYWAAYLRASRQGRPDAAALADARVEAPWSLVCPDGAEMAIGDGLAVALPGDPGAPPQHLADRLPPGLRVLDAGARPRAADILPLAFAALAAGEALPPESASPLYVRDKVALTAAEQIARRAAR